MGYRRLDQLGHRIFRIYDTGAREPDWLYGDEFGPAQNSARGHHINCLCAICGYIHERTVALGLSLGGAMHIRRCVLHISAKPYGALVPKIAPFHSRQGVGIDQGRRDATDLQNLTPCRNNRYARETPGPSLSSAVIQVQKRSPTIHLLNAKVA